MSECYLCRSEGQYSHEPIEDQVCHACGKPYMTGCKQTHHHTSRADCEVFWDIRTCRVCGDYIHKDCQKSGADYAFDHSTLFSPMPA